MNFIDSHCHLHDSRILDDMPGIGTRPGVKKLVKALKSAFDIQQIDQGTTKQDLEKKGRYWIKMIGILVGRKGRANENSQNQACFAHSVI